MASIKGISIVSLTFRAISYSEFLRVRDTNYNQEREKEGEEKNNGKRCLSLHSATWNGQP
jgi:hypothetical protein